nr:MAG TPA: hypothetical protein [Caudoviricetes sp.]
MVTQLGPLIQSGIDFGKRSKNRKSQKVRGIKPSVLTVQRLV